MNVAERAALGPKGNVPALRFPEFEGEWKTTNLGNVVKVIKNKVCSESVDTDKYVSTENMLPNFDGVVNSAGKPERINITAFNPNDILLANIRPYLKKIWLSTFYGGCNADVFVFRPQGINHQFLYYSVANERFCMYVMSGAKGVKMPRGDKQQMLKFEFSVPMVAEQKKIASLLALLDDRIATQRKIIEDLEQLKSALYHMVFSTIKGRTVALKSVANIVKGKQLNGTELSDNGDYYVMNGGIAPSGYYKEYNTPANTISISEGGNSCGYVQFNYKPFWSGGHCYTLHLLNEGVNLQFLYHFLKYREKDIMALRIGSGLPNIQKKDLGNFSVLLPIINEQNKAVRLFEAIQNKIDVDTELLKQLLVQKQCLLQQMFI